MSGGKLYSVQQSHLPQRSRVQWKRKYLSGKLWESRAHSIHEIARQSQNTAPHDTALGFPRPALQLVWGNGSQLHMSAYHWQRLMDGECRAAWHCESRALSSSLCAIGQCTAGAFLCSRYIGTSSSLILVSWDNIRTKSVTGGGVYLPVCSVVYQVVLCNLDVPQLGMRFQRDVLQSIIYNPAASPC